MFVARATNTRHQGRRDRLSQADANSKTQQGVGVTIDWKDSAQVREDAKILLKAVFRPSAKIKKPIGRVIPLAAKTCNRIRRQVCHAVIEQWVTKDAEEVQ